MKKLVAACTFALALGLVTPWSAAQAATDRCVTKGEFRQVQKGMSPRQVKRLFETGGRTFFKFGPDETREYRTCSTDGFVLVTFKRGKVVKKNAVWS